jgi:selenocysteine-specific elongation factor
MSTPGSDVTPSSGFVIGTGGHVDHGKTALVRALTGVETDRWKEERERGLTIDIGFAELPLDQNLETGIVDVPGHEDFLKNMLAGATGIDLLLLVIAADEGPMPQTYEHLAIARLLGIEHGVVALTKTDRVDEAWLELAKDATGELLCQVLGHESWPIVPVSAPTGSGLEALREALRRELRATEAREGHDLFRLPVDRSFSIRGTGTVVTGTLWTGSVAVGDQLTVMPGGHVARVRALQVHGHARSNVSAGHRCALALVGLEPPQAPRGSVLVSDDNWCESARLGVRLQVLQRPGRPLEHGQRIRVYLGTRETMARVLSAGAHTLEPGASGWAVLVLEDPLVARVRDRLILRFYSPVTTIGGGEIAELDPPRQWDSRTGAWASILDDDPCVAIRAAIQLRDTWGLPEVEAPLATGCTAAAVKETGETDSELLRIGEVWFSKDALDRTTARTLEAVERLQETHRRASAVSLSAVRAQARRSCASELVDAALGGLSERGVVQIDGPRVSLPGHEPRLTETEREARGEILRRIRMGGLQPPTVKDLGRALGIDRDLLDDLLPLLQDEGRIVAITPEIHIACEERESLVARVRDLLADGGVAPPTRFKEALDLSRKYLIPILEYLDREGVTRRTGDGRVLAR